MKKKIKFSLVYRDMWQSSGKFQPRKDQLERIAPVIIDMGCFARVETNGGAFEQVNLMAGENPNLAVRAFCKPFNEVGIQTHMLDRGLNALRMYPVPDDVRELMYKVKKAQGVDIPRIFCGLNDTRNIIPSIKWAKAAGMIPQATLCITTSPVHTVEYYSKIADEVIAAGAEEICLKDMAGIGQPALLARQSILRLSSSITATLVLVCQWLLSWRFVTMVPTSSIPLSNHYHGVRFIPTSSLYSPC